MEKTSEQDVPEGLNGVPADDAQDRPPVKPFDPHFGSLFERSEGFFRRYETIERPDADE